jgi:hypothetical protein
MLIGNATNMDMPQDLGQFVITSRNAFNSIDSMARDIMPDIASAIRKENM